MSLTTLFDPLPLAQQSRRRRRKPDTIALELDVELLEHAGQRVDDLVVGAGACLRCVATGQQVGRREMPPILLWAGTPIVIGPLRITMGVIIVAIMAVIMAFILSQTSWGRHVYAVGDDAEAARQLQAVLRTAE